jgi:ribonuclease HI/exonuclease III
MSEPLRSLREAVNVRVDNVLHEGEFSPDNITFDEINPIIQQPGERWKGLRKLVLLSWNLRGISFGSTASREKMELIVNCISLYNVDVVFLQETHLNHDDMHWFNSHFGNFCWFHSCGLNGTRGAAVGIRKAILRGHKVDVISRDKVGRWVIVKARIHDSSDCVFSSIYVPQFVNKAWTLQDWSAKLKSVIGVDVVVGGDFNINLEKDEFATLLNVSDTLSLSVVENSIPTFANKSVIDYMLVSKNFPLNVASLDVLAGYSKDHDLILLVLNDGETKRRKLPNTRLSVELCESIIIHDEAMMRVGKFDKEGMCPLKYLNSFSDAIRSIIEENSKVILSDDIRKSLSLVVLCLRVAGPGEVKEIWSEDPFVQSIVEEFKGFDPPSLKSARRKWKALVRKKIREMRRDFGCKTSHLLKRDRRKLKKIFGPGEFHIVHENKKVECPASAEKLVGDFWSNLFSTERMFNPKSLNRLVKLMPTLHLCENERYSANKAKLRKVITKKCSSNAGPDGNPFSLFSSSYDLLEDVWICLVEGLADGAIVPDRMFGDSLLVLANKADGGIGVGDFRPISITNVIYRLVMKYFGRELRNTISPIISINQRALLKGRTIHSAVRHIVDGFYGRIHTGLPTIFLKTDFYKAFDAINRTALKCVLQRINLPTHLRRISNIALENSISYIPSIHGPVRTFDLVTGVRQGCPISPLLFLIVVDMLVRSMSLVKGVEFFGAYADDNGVVCSNAAALRALYSKIRTYEISVGAKINITKCAIVTNICNLKTPKVWEGIKRLDCAPYLGVTIGVKVSAADIWGSVMKKARATSLRIKSFKGNFREKVALINQHIVPLSAYVGQFYLMPPEVAGSIWNSIRWALGTKGAIGNKGLSSRVGPFSFSPCVRDPFLTNVSSLLSSFPRSYNDVSPHPLSTTYQRNLAVQYLKSSLKFIPLSDSLFGDFVSSEGFKRMKEEVGKKNLTGWIYDLLINCESPSFSTRLLKEVDADRQINYIYIYRNLSFGGKHICKNNFIQLLNKSWNSLTKLKLMGIKDDNMCKFCNDAPQSHVHLIRDCSLCKWIYNQHRSNPLWPRNEVDLMLGDRILSKMEVLVRLKIINILKFAVSKLCSREEVIRLLDHDVGSLLSQSRSNYRSEVKPQTGSDVNCKHSHVLRFDGSANPLLLNGGFGYWIAFEGEEIFSDAGNLGLANVNQAEICALEKGLESAVRLGIKKLSVVGDSKFAVKIGSIGNICRNPKYLVPYCRIQHLIKFFDEYEILFAPRRFNSRADVLAYTGCNAPELIHRVVNDPFFTHPQNEVSYVHKFSVPSPNSGCQRYFSIRNPLDRRFVHSRHVYPLLLIDDM